MPSRNSTGNRPSKSKSSDQRALTKKWGAKVIARKYAVIPSVLLQGQARLSINPTDLAVLVHLIEHWWKPDDMPWPSKRRIAERLGVSDKTVQRAIVNLEKQGLVERKRRFYRTGGRATNEYDLRPLVQRLKEIAKDMDEADKNAAHTKRDATRPGLKRRKSTQPNGGRHVE